MGLWAYDRVLMLVGVWDRDGILAQALRQVTIIADRVQEISAGKCILKRLKRRLRCIHFYPVFLI